MQFNILHNKEKIQEFLLKDKDLHIYELGDLDDFFWPYTIWYGLIENDDIKAISILYVGGEPSTLLAFSPKDIYPMKNLLKQIKTFLPQRFNTHLTPGLIHSLGSIKVIKDFGLHYKMSVRKSDFIAREDYQNIRNLSTTDHDIVNKLLNESYPGNWYDKRMLETGKYYGYFIENRLVGIAGIHVYSKEFSVAALGSITTHPDFRGKGICKKVTSRLCFNLFETVDTIGLNVESANLHAVKAYQSLGFKIIGEYEERQIEFGN